MTILYFISLSLFVCYIVVLLLRFGIPKSISESSYLYGRKGNLIFWGWLTTVIFTLLIPWLNYAEGQPYQFLVFISCAALFFTAITGRFRGDEGVMQANIHQYGTILCAICAQLWMWLTLHNSWKLSIIAFTVAILLGLFTKGAQRNLKTNAIERNNNALVFWVEMALFTMAYVSIFYFMKIK